jgi:hypothetical protein
MGESQIPNERPKKRQYHRCTICGLFSDRTRLCPKHKEKLFAKELPLKRDSFIPHFGLGFGNDSFFKDTFSVVRDNFPVQRDDK